MVENYISQRSAAQLAARREKLGAIRTPQEAVQRVAEIRSICNRILGPSPERSELQPKTIRTLPRDGYSIEVLTWQSMPGVLTTANLYLPEGQRHHPPPHPAVVCLPGHWADGKSHAEYQRMGQLLSRKGIAALIPDLCGQGERLEFYDSTLHRSWIGSSPKLAVADERTQVGNLFFLTGHHLSRFLIWDAMRALDLLSERGDIDRERLGVTGVAGSGAITRLLCCLEPRLKAAVIVADNFSPDSLGGEDAEHSLFDGFPLGLSPLDLLVPFAPRPLLLGYCSADKPFALMETCLTELTHWYTLLGGKDKVAGFIAEGQQSYLKELRTLAADHFARAFGMPEERVREPESPPEISETLACTETGQIRNSLNSLSLFDYQRELARDLPPALAVPRDENAAQKLQHEVRERFVPLLRMPAETRAMNSEVESHSRDWGYQVEKGRIVIDEGLYVPYSFYALPQPADDPASGKSAPTVLALHERGIAGISAQGTWMTAFAEAGMHVMTIDVCGVGETRLQPDREDKDPYDALLCGSEALWARRALNAGTSLLGMRVLSVLRSVEFLKSRWDVEQSRIALIGVGRAALWSLFAGALESSIARVVLLRGLSTYKCLVEHRRHNHHFSQYLPGALREFDLPHVACCLAPRPLTLINTVNQRKERCAPVDSKRDYALTSEIYKQFKSAPNFRMLATDSPLETLQAVQQALGSV